MKSIKFLDIDDVLKIYKIVINEFGGRFGIRDLKLLEAAVYQPQVAAQYIDNDIFEIAAIYMFHIIKNHPFVDGNKRTALITTITFLELNNLIANYENDSLYKLTIGVADSSINKNDIANFFKSINQK